MKVPNGNFSLFLEFFFILQYCYKLADTMFGCCDSNVVYLKTNCSQKQLLDDLLSCFDLRVTSSEFTIIFKNVNHTISISEVDYTLTNGKTCDITTKVFEAHMGDHRVMFSDYCVKTEYNLTRKLSPQSLDDF